MTDSQQPYSDPSNRPPAYNPPPGPPSYGAPASTTYPGKTLGIVAFILALAGLIIPVLAPLLGLILGIVALAQSRKAGHKNGLALAAIIISSILIVVGIIVTVLGIIAIGAAASEYARLCAEYGTGTHQINGVTVTLTCPS